jgi:hypothetical protein
MNTTLPEKPSHDYFATTRWTVVLSAGRKSSVQSERALGDLCQIYWYPLYAYVRRRGYTKEDAEDLVQSFFARLLEKNYLEGLDAGRGKFRAFLLASLPVQLLPGGNITDRNNIRVNGQPNVTFGIRLEGQDQSRALDPNNSDMVAPSVEAVQEISVQTSNFAAEYGQVAGGLCNFTTKSGTNQVHGSAYGYFVNEALHAGRPFTDDGSGEHIRAKDRKQDYGASLGAPLYIPKVYDGRNKSFFFISFEGFRNRVGANDTILTVPTQEMYNGDFRNWVNGSGALIPLYDPNTTRANPNGTGFIRDPFAGNQIPVGRFSPLAVKMAQFGKAASPNRGFAPLRGAPAPGTNPASQGRSPPVPTQTTDHAAFRLRPERSP